MPGAITSLLEQMSANYHQQFKLYQKVYQITQAESWMIEAQEMMRLMEMLHFEDEMMRRICELEEPQKRNRELLRSAMPGNKISLDQLAFLTETPVFLRYKKALTELSEILAEIEVEKNRNIAELARL